MTEEEIDYIESEIKAYDAKKERMSQYKELYSEDVADALGRAHAMYPWVNAEILVPLVLGGAEAAVPEVAKIAAKESMERGITPYMGTEEYIRKNVPRTAVVW